MITIKNDYLEAQFDPKGAEISKLIGMQDGLNYMWKQDPCLWGHSAPVLFPIVGALKNGTCRIDGKEYHMNQHGFSRNTEYEVYEHDDTHVVFHLSSSDEIKKMYPYEFDLYVTYTLVDNKLKAEFRVENHNEDVIYFQIGGHPAFACPFIEGEDANDYYIEFEQNETVNQKIIDVERKGMSHETKRLFDNERHFFVRQAMFDNDAVVVPHFKSRYVSLKSLTNNKSLNFYMNGFDHLGLWTSKHVGGLLAIEPWVGHTDYVDFEGDFKDKESAVALKKGETFNCEFAVEIFQ